jgi:hypothetical protein
MRSRGGSVVLNIKQSHFPLSVPMLRSLKLSNGFDAVFLINGVRLEEAIKYIQHSIHSTENV